MADKNMDFTHLSEDEKINGIKMTNVPQYIREKAYLTDFSETLAQLAEMIIQLGVNLSLDPDEALEWARKLQESVSQSEFDSWVATLLDGGPSLFFETKAALIAKHPNGAPGVALVRETDPAKIYVWNGSAWEDFGAYQGIEVKDGSIEPKHTTFFETGKNIFDKSKVIEGHYVNQVSGALQANSAHKASSPMPVEAGATYVSAQFLQRYAVYNGETFVSGGLNAFTVTIPIGANRLVVSSDSFDIDTLQIEKGTVATAYEPYRYKIKDELLPTVYGDSNNQFVGDGAKKYRVVGANIRTPLAAGLPFTLLDDEGHEPMGITSVTIVGEGLRIGMPFTADKVISMNATPHVSMRNEGWEVATTGGLSVHEVHFYKNGVHIPASEVVQNGGSFWYSGVFLV